MSDLISDISGAITGGTGAAADLATASGYFDEANAYQTAAGLAIQNKGLQQASTAIQVQQTQRQINQTIGGAKADIGAAGLQEHGSAIDVIRNSAQQGALQTQLLKTQGQIEETAYGEQAAAYVGEEAQANATGQAQQINAAGSAASGLVKGIGAIATIAALFFL